MRVATVVDTTVLQLSNTRPFGPVDINLHSASLPPMYLSLLHTRVAGGADPTVSQMNVSVSSGHAGTFEEGDRYSDTLGVAPASCKSANTS